MPVRRLMMIGMGLVLLCITGLAVTVASSSWALAWAPPGTQPLSTPTATATPCTVNAVQNGNFETSVFAPWVVLSSSPAPFVASTPTYPVHNGTYSAHLGSLPGGETAGNSAIYQTISVPPSGGTLSYWYWPRTIDSISFDWQDAYVTNITGQLPITLTLCVSGTPVAYGATTDSSGFFTVTTSLPTGSYNWRAKGPKYLATSGTALLTAGAITQVEMGQQRAGDTDATHNNVVNSTDFNALKNVFGTASPIGDLNNDGVSNSTDFNLLKGNFGTAGAAVNCP